MATDLQPGDIILCRAPWKLWSGDGWLSWIIRKIEGRNWSHVAWYRGPLDGKEVIEAKPEGTRYSSIGNFHLDDPNRVRVVRIKPEFLSQSQVLMAQALAEKMYLGNKYDFLLLLKLAWYYFTKDRKKQIPDDPHRSICCEDVTMPLWTMYQFIFKPCVSAIKTTPGDISASPYVEPVFSTSGTIKVKES